MVPDFQILTTVGEWVQVVGWRGERRAIEKRMRGRERWKTRKQAKLDGKKRNERQLFKTPLRSRAPDDGKEPLSFFSSASPFPRPDGTLLPLSELFLRIEY